MRPQNKTASKMSDPTYRYFFNYGAGPQTRVRLQAVRDDIQLSFTFPAHVSSDDRVRMRNTLTASIHDHLSQPWTSNSATSARTVLVKEAEDGNPKSTEFAREAGLFMKSVIGDAASVSNDKLRSLMRSVNYRATVIVGVPDSTDVMTVHSDAYNASMSPTSSESEDGVTLVEQPGILEEKDAEPKFSIAIAVGDTRTSYITSRPVKLQSTLGDVFRFEFAEATQTPSISKRCGMIFDGMTLSKIIDMGLGTDPSESKTTNQAIHTSEGAGTIVGDTTGCGSASTEEPEDWATIVNHFRTLYDDNDACKDLWSHIYTNSQEGRTDGESLNEPSSWMNKTNLFWRDRKDSSFWPGHEISSVGKATADDLAEEDDGYGLIESNERHDDYVYV